jgi:hypothetical protein
MKKPVTRVLSIILAAVLLTQVVPLHGMITASAAPATQQTQAPSAPDVPQEPSRHVSEEVSMRTADAKLFNNEDGSGTAYVYPNNIHFEDENGDWQEYDNTLVDHGDFYAPKASNLGIAMPGVLGGENAIALKSDQFGLSLGVPGANSEAIVPDLAGLEQAVLQNVLKDVDFSQVKPADISSDEATPVSFFNEQFSAVRNQESVIYYLNAFSGADLEYTILSDQVKENIIVNEKSDKYVYNFTLDLQNLIAVAQNERAIHLFDAQTGDLKAKIEAPYATDAAGEMNTETITLALSGNALTVTADAKWMNAKERQFPVALDPTYSFVVDEFGMANASVNDKLQRNNPLSFQLNVGTRKGFTDILNNNVGVVNKNRSFLRFEMPALPQDAVVTNATLMLDDNATPSWAKMLYWLAEYLELDWAVFGADLLYYFL